MGGGRSGGRAATGTRDASRDSWDRRGPGVGRDAGGGLVGFPGVSRGGDRVAPSQVTVSFRSDSQGPRRAQARPAEGRRRGKACGLKPPPPLQPPSSAQLPPAFSAHSSLWRAAICPARPRRSLQARPPLPRPPRGAPSRALLPRHFCQSQQVLDCCPSPKSREHVLGHNDQGRVEQTKGAQKLHKQMSERMPEAPEGSVLPRHPRRLGVGVGVGMGTREGPAEGPGRRLWDVALAWPRGWRGGWRDTVRLVHQGGIRAAAAVAGPWAVTGEAGRKRGQRHAGPGAWRAGRARYKCVFGVRTL